MKAVNVQQNFYRIIYAQFIELFIRNDIFHLCFKRKLLSVC